MVAFEDFRKASFFISASRPQFFIPQQQETCQDAGAAFIGHSASHHVRDLTGNQACSQKPYGNGRVDLAGFQLVITKPLAEPGREYMVFDIPEKKTKVGVQICYDLNFPEISRNETLMGAEVLVKLTMDPQELYKLNEHYHYVRALKNQAYLVCTNGTGFFGSHHLYGHSQIISPEGHCIWEAGETPTICTMTLDLDLVARCRKYGTNFQDHYLRHLFEYNFPMPYADDFKKAPRYKEIGEGPRNVAEYDANIADVMENPIGKRAPENMDVDT